MPSPAPLVCFLFEPTEWGIQMKRKTSLAAHTILCVFVLLAWSPASFGQLGDPDFRVTITDGGVLDPNHYCTLGTLASPLVLVYKKNLCYAGLYGICGEVAFDLCQGTGPPDHYNRVDENWSGYYDGGVRVCAECSATCQVWCDNNFDWGDCWSTGTEENCESTCTPNFDFNGYCVPLGDPYSSGDYQGCWGCADGSWMNDPPSGGGGGPRDERHTAIDDFPSPFASLGSGAVWICTSEWDQATATQDVTCAYTIIP